MKKVVFIIFTALLIHSGVSAQDILPSQVPSVVMNKMRHDYPQAKSVEWEMKGSNYEVEFEIGIYRRDHEILYTPSGEEIYHKQEISSSDLPSAIKEAVKRDYPNYRISDASKIQKGTEVTYKFELKSGKIELDLRMDEAGNVVNKK